MKKTPYITVLTAFALLFRLYAVSSYNPLLLLVWMAGLAVLLAGELIGMRVGKGFRYAANIGAAVSSALILTVSIIWLLFVMREYPADYLDEMWSAIYDIIGFIAIASALINLGSAAAKRVLVWREHHGALADEGLTLRAFRTHFIAAAAMNVISVAAVYVILIFFSDLFSDRSMWGIIWIPVSVLNIAIVAETANMIGIFFDWLLEKRVINNILIAARGIVGIFVNVKFLTSVSKPVVEDWVYVTETGILSARVGIAAWAAIIAAAGMWAAVKLRKPPSAPLPDNG